MPQPKLICCQTRSSSKTELTFVDETDFMAKLEQYSLNIIWLAVFSVIASSCNLLCAQELFTKQKRFFESNVTQPVIDQAVIDQAVIDQAVSSPFAGQSALQQPLIQPENLQSFQQKRPRGIPGSLDAEWITDSDFGQRTLGAGIRVPLLFLRREGGPPPMVNFGFNHTEFNFDNEFGLPPDLYEVTFGLSGVRKLSDRWAVRTILGADFATDGDNRSSDAWRFRGGAFAIWDANAQLKLSFGAIALGRSDLPVVPAVGAIWVPNDRTRWDLILPRPKVSYLVTDNGVRQNWVYTGVALAGNTWGYETNAGVDQQLSYGDWRAVLGWESRPSAPADVPFVLGRKYSAEFGYAFSRDLELDEDAADIPLRSSFLIRLSTRY